LVFARVFLHDGDDHGELETGATVLAFCAHSLLRTMGKTPQAADPDRPCAEIAFRTRVG